MWRPVEPASDLGLSDLHDVLQALALPREGVVDLLAAFAIDVALTAVELLASL